jgi:hypothetical protein
VARRHGFVAVLAAGVFVDDRPLNGPVRTIEVTARMAAWQRNNREDHA